MMPVPVVGTTPITPVQWLPILSDGQLATAKTRKGCRPAGKILVRRQRVNQQWLSSETGCQSFHASTGPRYPRLCFNPQVGCMENCDRRCNKYGVISNLKIRATSGLPRSDVSIYSLNIDTLE